MQSLNTHIPSLLPLGALGVVVLQFSIPKPSPQQDLEFLADHPQIINQNCVDAMFKAVEDLRAKNQATHAFLFYWKANLLAACLDKGPEKFFDSLSTDGGLAKFLSKIEMPAWLSESPHAAELKELFTKIDDIHEEAVRADAKQQRDKTEQSNSGATSASVNSTAGSLAAQISDTGDKVGSVEDPNKVPSDVVDKWIYLRSHWTENFAKAFHALIEAATPLEKKNKEAVEKVLSAEEKVTAMAVRLKSAPTNAQPFHEALNSATEAARAQPLLADFVPLLISDVTPSVLPQMASWVLNSTEHNHADPQLIALTRSQAESTRGMAYAMSELKSLLSSHLNNPNAIFVLFSTQHRSEVDTFPLMLRKFRYQAFLHVLAHIVRDL